MEFRQWPERQHWEDLAGWIWGCSEHSPLPNYIPKCCLYNNDWRHASLWLGGPSVTNEGYDIFPSAGRHTSPSGPHQPSAFLHTHR